MSAPESIAHYRIVGKLGEGGMGAVYRAADTRLNREVAIKVLPTAVAEDSARMARFDREAQLLASLNHPNIAAIYGLEQGAIVMELVEGVELKGPVPVEIAIDYARQIVAGLEAAHEKDIVHRDLKPANVKVTPDGVVKLLDFGLAKSLETNSAAFSPTLSPTLSLGMTQAGMILGTAAYMAPEQARGKVVDKRADIWAFGVVVFELLTGTPLFGDCETIHDSLAAVITREPDWAALPKNTPPALRRLLQRCLRKDPRLRLRDIGEARIALDELDAGETVATVTPANRYWILRTCIALASIAVVVLGAMLWTRYHQAEPLPFRFVLPMPEGSVETVSTAAPQVAPSPDGRALAIVATGPDGKTALWLRPTNATVANRLDKTGGANFPFWSPDSRSIAFFAEGKLKKVWAAGGSPQTICDAPEAPGSSSSGDGGTWNSDGIIVFSNGNKSPLLQVAAVGGTATPITSLAADTGETRHSWPQFLPDRRHILFFSGNADSSKSEVRVAELHSSKSVTVMRNSFRAVWSQAGYLVFARAGFLLAQEFDPRTFHLAGEPITIAEDVRINESNGRAAFSVSNSGVMVIRAGGAAQNLQLAWYDRQGKRQGVIGKRDEYRGLSISPDDKYIALAIGHGAQVDTWIVSRATGVFTRLTRDGVGSISFSPAWSSDSLRLALNRPDRVGIVEVTVASGAGKVLTTDDFEVNDWSPDRKTLLGTTNRLLGLSLLNLDGVPQFQTIGETAYRRSGFRFSPDGKSVAYVSYESGKDQIFVASFPSFAAKRQISVDGGDEPSWRKDGKELYFLAPGGILMAADWKAENAIPQPVFKFSPVLNGHSAYAADHDGSHFLVIETDQGNRAAWETTVIVNWAADIKRF